MRTARAIASLAVLAGALAGCAPIPGPSDTRGKLDTCDRVDAQLSGNPQEDAVKIHRETGHYIFMAIDLQYRFSFPGLESGDSIDPRAAPSIKQGFRALSTHMTCDFNVHERSEPYVRAYNLKMLELMGSNPPG